ncbi:MAG: NAD(P)-dependent oxidoreductase [Arcobacteraceae bacterium]
MKNVLVTGSNGFIGSELVKELKKIDINVLEFNSLDGDIAEYDFIKKYRNTEISHIFHLASKIFVPDSWKSPLSFYKTTVIGTGNILELCRTKNIPLTYVSAYLYGIAEKLPISEDERLKSNNPYAHSKYLAEELCKFYSEFYKVKVIIIRPFNIYGENQKEIFLIPHIINQVLNKESIQVKDLYPKRDYLYLKDLIVGLIKTIKYEKQFSIFNFGSGISLSVDEIIKVIQKVANTRKKIISENITRNNEIMDIVADISYAKRELNWEPKYSFEDGIKAILLNCNNLK